MDFLYVLIAIVVVIFIIIVWYISVSNKIVRASIKVDESFSGIDVALAKRYDVLTKMVDVVKGYTKHEKEILLKVVELRNNMSMQEKKDANAVMDENFNKINAVVENYPDLKASENFKILQQSVVDVEEHLQAARRLYNSNVSLYNQMIITFPNNIVAKNKGAIEKGFFEVDDIKREDVKIKL
mgnify:FL=1